jgi:hypothetical protein
VAAVLKVRVGKPIYERRSPPFPARSRRVRSIAIERGPEMRKTIYWLSWLLLLAVLLFSLFHTALS